MYVENKTRFYCYFSNATTKRIRSEEVGYMRERRRAIEELKEKNERKK